MKIDEICREVESNGFGNLQDSDINAYVAWKCEIAANEARFSAECEKNDKILDELAESQRKISEHAAETFQKLLDEPLKLERIDA